MKTMNIMISSLIVVSCWLIIIMEGCVTHDKHAGIPAHLSSILPTLSIPFRLSRTSESIPSQSVSLLVRLLSIAVQRRLPKDHRDWAHRVEPVSKVELCGSVTLATNYLGTLS